MSDLLRAHVTRLCYALNQFAAFDGVQTEDTASLWVETRGKADKEVAEALDAAFQKTEPNTKEG